MLKKPTKPKRHTTHIFLIAFTLIALYESHLVFLVIAASFNILAIFQFFRSKTKPAVANRRSAVPKKSPENIHPRPGEPGYAQWEFQNESYINFF
ncbi:MAG: hypothetical protein AAF902_03620 [Chloroflexota bacterium]